MKLQHHCHKAEVVGLAGKMVRGVQQGVGGANLRGRRQDQGGGEGEGESEGKGEGKGGGTSTEDIGGLL